jgi:hypothetical protein
LLALSLLVTGVALADDAHDTATFHDLAVHAAFLHRGFNLHAPILPEGMARVKRSGGMLDIKYQIADVKTSGSL